MEGEREYDQALKYRQDENVAHWLSGRTVEALKNIKKVEKNLDYKVFFVYL